MTTPWISVKDELPPEGEVVRTKIHNGDFGACFYNLKRVGEKWVFATVEAALPPTHWMRVEPPKDL
jgi:hypothetical protein